MNVHFEGSGTVEGTGGGTRVRTVEGRHSFLPRKKEVGREEEEETERVNERLRYLDLLPLPLFLSLCSLKTELTTTVLNRSYDRPGLFMN